MLLEPDNYAKCCKRVQNVPLPNIQLINAGLSDQEGIAVFKAGDTMGSHIIPNESNPANIGGAISIRTTTIDGIVNGRTVGFIKMDIESAEFDRAPRSKKHHCPGQAASCNQRVSFAKGFMMVAERSTYSRISSA